MELHNIKSLNINNIEDLLKELGKEIRKEYGKNADVELNIVGGASIIMNYGVRESTTDIDAAIRTRSSIKSLIYKIADRHDLSDKWLNDDFKKTSSYSDKIDLYSKPYKSYSGVLHVRTISDEYLLAMKLKSFRGYKNDISDIARVIKETNSKYTIEDITRAYKNLYGISEEINPIAFSFIENCINNPDKINIPKIISNESINKSFLLENNNEASLKTVNNNIEKELISNNDTEENDFLQKLKKAKEKAAENKTTNKMQNEYDDLDR